MKKNNYMSLLLMVFSYSTGLFTMDDNKSAQYLLSKLREQKNNPAVSTPAISSHETIEESPYAILNDIKLPQEPKEMEHSYLNVPNQSNKSEHTYLNIPPQNNKSEQKQELNVKTTKGTKLSEFKQKTSTTTTTSHDYDNIPKNAAPKNKIKKDKDSIISFLESETLTKAPQEEQWQDTGEETEGLFKKAKNFLKQFMGKTFDESKEALKNMKRKTNQFSVDFYQKLKNAAEKLTEYRNKYEFSIHNLTEEDILLNITSTNTTKPYEKSNINLRSKSAFSLSKIPTDKISLHATPKGSSTKAAVWELPTKDPILIKKNKKGELQVIIDNE